MKRDRPQVRIEVRLGKIGDAPPSKPPRLIERRTVETSYVREVRESYEAGRRPARKRPGPNR